MNDACHTLTFPYTYQLVTVPPAKREARKQIGSMAADIVKTMRDEVLEEGIGMYLESRGLTPNEVKAILGDVDGTRKARIADFVNRSPKRESEAESAPEETGHVQLNDRNTTQGDS